MRKIISAFTLTSALLLAGGASQAQTELRIAASTKTGSSYAVATGMAAALAKTPGYSASLTQSSGLVDNIKQIASGAAQIGFASSDLLAEAQQGEGAFKDGRIAVQTLLVLFPTRLHIIATEASGITKVSDLKGKRVSTAQRGSGTDVVATRLLEVAGLDPEKDIARERLDASPANERMRAGALDARFQLGGLPVPNIAELMAAGAKVRLIDLADTSGPLMSKYSGLYIREVIPANTYQGQDREVSVVAATNLLVAKPDLPEQVAYDFVKSILERKADVAAAHPEGNNLALERQRQAGSPAPFHPGAVRYFREKGVSM
jgi:uncharacterized protein